MSTDFMALTLAAIAKGTTLTILEITSAQTDEEKLALFTHLRQNLETSLRIESEQNAPDSFEIPHAAETLMEGFYQAVAQILHLPTSDDSPPTNP